MDGQASPLFEFDKALAGSLRSVPSDASLIGIDEAGRGPLAGPVVASAVCLPRNFFELSLNDSKKLTPLQRERLYLKITESSFHSSCIVEPDTIDSINILQATFLAMRTAFNRLLEKHPELRPGLVIIDGKIAPDVGHPRKAVIRGDSKSACIAAASIVAKVTRDRIMRSLDASYPQYGFARHKGYGTALHLERLRKFGPCPIHRRSFAPVRTLGSAR